MNDSEFIYTKPEVQKTIDEKVVINNPGQRSGQTGKPRSGNISIQNTGKIIGCFWLGYVLTKKIGFECFRGSRQWYNDYIERESVHD